MADCYTPTVVQQTIPEADMTPLERLPLYRIFDAQCDGEEWYFFSEVGPADMIGVERAALEAALAASQAAGANAATGSPQSTWQSLRPASGHHRSSISILRPHRGSSSFRTSFGAHRHWSTYRLFLPSLVRACGLMVLEAPSS
ncbi:hypothetical protein [Bradyrhizobium sp. Cp5.3]|uniref:hypothetical protein n=1 Tax=Bradyrhizobium sp. Cp5.3 TaxID=443598 RepID=UPI0012EC2F1F|nr:hypothetical protein [Bradyrhizobium sp. Cp5.3]